MGSLKSSSSAGCDGGGEPPRKQKKLEQCADHEVAETKTCVLPDECVLEILSFLTLSELVIAQNVCTQWKRVSHFPVLWRNKTYCVYGYEYDYNIVSFLEEWPDVGNVILYRVVREPVINALCKNCRHLKSLEIYHLEKRNYWLLNKLVKKCRNIESLKISDNLLSDKRNARVLAKLNQLQSLQIVRCLFPDITLHLQPFADGCPQLTTLIVPTILDVPNNDLELFIKAKCKILTHLELPSGWFTKRRVLPLFKMCTALKEIKLYTFYQMEDVDFLEAFRVLGQLSSLQCLKMKDFWSCPGGAAALAFKSGGLSQLQVLCLNNWGQVDTILMDGICTGCPRLRELYLKHVKILSEDAFSHLHLLNKLETLCLVACDGLKGTAITYVAQVPKLRKLVVEHRDLRSLKPGLQSILDMCHLEILSFAFTNYACSFHFERIPEKLPKLRVLNVACCELDERVLERLKEQIPGLQVYAPDDANRYCQNQKYRIKRMMKL